MNRLATLAAALLLTVGVAFVAFNDDDGGSPPYRCYQNMDGIWRCF